ncbi:MAG: SH3 domain-containing protein [Alphaproteobacteria bacterium]|nr:SH3 domain-containing protein [Alphaproteobacteria bacterium]
MYSKPAHRLYTQSKIKRRVFSWPVLAVSALAWFTAVPVSGLPLSSGISEDFAVSVEGRAAFSRNCATFGCGAGDRTHLNTSDQDGLFRIAGLKKSGADVVLLGKPGNNAFCVTGLPKGDPQLVLRAEPSSNAKIRGRLPNGTVLAILERKGKWLHTKTRAGGDASGGWVLAETVAKYIHEVKEPEECTE